MYLIEIVCYRSDGSVDVVVQTEDIPARITRRHLEPTEMLKVRGTGENPAKNIRKITHYLQEAHIQPFENFSVVKLRVCGSDSCLQDTRQVVLVQSGGGTRQLWPGDKNNRNAPC